MFGSMGVRLRDLGIRSFLFDQQEVVHIFKMYMHKEEQILI